MNCNLTVIDREHGVLCRSFDCLPCTDYRANMKPEAPKPDVGEKVKESDVAVTLQDSHRHYDDKGRVVILTLIGIFNGFTITLSQTFRSAVVNCGHYNYVVQDQEERVVSVGASTGCPKDECNSYTLTEIMFSLYRTGTLNEWDDLL